MEKFKQKGKNSKYPNTIVCWKLGDIVPEWLSNISKVEAINEITGEKVLKTRDTNTGGFELLDSSGTMAIISTKNRTDIVCKDVNTLGNLFSLTPIQFDLLYIPLKP